MNEETQIIQALCADSRRDVYEAGGAGGNGNGQYFVSYQGGGPFTKATVLGMVEKKLLRRKYKTCECYVLVQNGE